MNKLRPMVSMEMDDEDKMDAIMPIAMPSKPDYPCGLRICITEKEFAKLNLDRSEAIVGGIFHLHAMARITSVHESDNGDSQCCRVEAQIEDMAIESEDAENEMDDAKEDKKPRKSRLYG